VIITLRIILAQIDSRVGDLEGTVEKIKKIIADAESRRNHLAYDINSFTTY